jgi:hypothetical protein
LQPADAQAFRESRRPEDEDEDEDEPTTRIVEVNYMVERLKKTRESRYIEVEDNVRPRLQMARIQPNGPVLIVRLRVADPN